MIFIHFKHIFSFDAKRGGSLFHRISVILTLSVGNIDMWVAPKQMRMWKKMIPFHICKHFLLRYMSQIKYFCIINSFYVCPKCLKVLSEIRWKFVRNVIVRNYFVQNISARNFLFLMYTKFIILNIKLHFTCSNFKLIRKHSQLQKHYVIGCRSATLQVFPIYFMNFFGTAIL